QLKGKRTGVNGKTRCRSQNRSDRPAERTGPPWQLQHRLQITAVDCLDGAVGPHLLQRSLQPRHGLVCGLLLQREEQLRNVEAQYALESRYAVPLRQVAPRRITGRPEIDLAILQLLDVGLVAQCQRRLESLCREVLGNGVALVGADVVAPGLFVTGDVDRAVGSR